MTQLPTVAESPRRAHGPETSGPETSGPETSGPETSGPETSGPGVVGGVDTHKDTHTAAAIDDCGRLLGCAQFPATSRGYHDLLGWLRSHGRLLLVGVEGTGAYGAGLTRLLLAEQVEVVEVDRPDRKTRRRHGKSDPLDAIAAAQAAQSGRATGRPKDRQGRVEALRALRVARRSAIDQRADVQRQLKALIITAPDTLRERLRHLTNTRLITTCAPTPPPAPTPAPTAGSRWRCAAWLGATNTCPPRSASWTS